MRTLRITFVVSLSLFVSSCGQNIFYSLRPTTDESLLFDAKQHMSNREWTEAIASISDMSATAQATSEVKLELAKAYAGRCGLDLIALLQTFTDSPTARIFSVLLDAFQDSTVSSFNDCVSAEAAIHSISTNATLRTGDQNLVMAFIELGKIGAILATRADPDGDGVSNWAEDDSCTVGNGVTNFLTSTEARHVATGFGQALRALENAGGTFGGDISTDLSTICTTIAGAPYNLDMCNDTNTGQINATEESLMRTIVQEGQMGIGLDGCATGAHGITDCPCP